MDAPNFAELADGLRARRREWATALRAQGLSIREVADTLGVGVGTIAADLAGTPHAQTGDEFLRDKRPISGTAAKATLRMLAEALPPDHEALQPDHTEDEGEQQ